MTLAKLKIMTHPSTDQPGYHDDGRDTEEEDEEEEDDDDDDDDGDKKPAAK
jgi:hypothetical protein